MLPFNQNARTALFRLTPLQAAPWQTLRVLKEFFRGAVYRSGQYRAKTIYGCYDRPS